MGTYSVANPGQGNWFIGVLSSQAMGVPAPPIRLPDIRLLPNPSAATVLIQAGQPLTGVLTVCDAAGRGVYTQPVVRQTTVRLSLEGLPAGIYTVGLCTASGTWTDKLLLQH